MAGTTGELDVGETIGPPIAGCCAGIVLVCFDGIGTAESVADGAAADTRSDELCFTTLVFSTGMMGGFGIGGATTTSIGARFLLTFVCSKMYFTV